MLSRNKLCDTATEKMCKNHVLTRNAYPYTFYDAAQGYAFCIKIGRYLQNESHPFGWLFRFG